MHGCVALKLERWAHAHNTTAVVKSIINGKANEERRGIISMVMLICWELWQERNEGHFQKQTPNLMKHHQHHQKKHRAMEAGGYTTFTAPPRGFPGNCTLSSVSPSLASFLFLFLLLITHPLLDQHCFPPSTF